MSEPIPDLQELVRHVSVTTPLGGDVLFYVQVSDVERLLKRVKALEAENRKLREAASRVVNYWRDNPDCCPSVTLEAMIGALAKALEENTSGD